MTERYDPMPAMTYEELLVEALPARIEDDAEYDRIYGRFKELFTRKKLTKAEQRLYSLLALLIEDYDRKHALPPTNDTPAERLQYLLEESGKKSTDLLPIFGTRSHVSEALNGKRPISAAQARKLGEMFSLNPGYFL